MLDTFRSMAVDWCERTFGRSTVDSVPERSRRFAEEAIELAQAMGVTRQEVLALVDYVYDREPGDPEQEIAGTLLTLVLLEKAAEMNMLELAFAELEKVNTPEMMEKIRAKHLTKAIRTETPGDYIHASDG